MRERLAGAEEVRLGDVRDRVVVELAAVAGGIERAGHGDWPVGDGGRVGHDQPGSLDVLNEDLDAVGSRTAVDARVRIRVCTRDDKDRADTARLADVPAVGGVPSPQSMLAAKSLKGAVGLASVKVATAPRNTGGANTGTGKRAASLVLTVG